MLKMSNIHQTFHTFSNRGRMNARFSVVAAIVCDDVLANLAIRDTGSRSLALAVLRCREQRFMLSHMCPLDGGRTMGVPMPKPTAQVGGAQPPSLPRVLFALSAI